jgi:hypothetical protein
MLKSHIDSKELVILANSRVSHNAGHTVNRGTPREIFIREFLAEHLSEKVAIGTGEIIDANSRPRQVRNQMDIVIYRREYPKLHLGGAIHAFLAESVVATIEVKSVLTQQDLHAAIVAASRIKALQRNLITSYTAGYQPPSILNFVVGYDGPASMGTVYNWLAPIHQALGIVTNRLSITERDKVASPSVDGIFLLGKGFIQYDNTPSTFVTDQMRQQNPLNSWFWSDLSSGSLLYLFVQLTQAVSGVAGSWLNPIPYLSDFRAKINFDH